jgi:hypothetical protein
MTSQHSWDSIALIRSTTIHTVRVIFRVRVRVRVKVRVIRVRVRVIIRVKVRVRVRVNSKTSTVHRIARLPAWEPQMVDSIFSHRMEANPAQVRSVAPRPAE